MWDGEAGSRIHWVLRNAASVSVENGEGGTLRGGGSRTRWGIGGSFLEWKIGAEAFSSSVDDWDNVWVGLGSIDVSSSGIGPPIVESMLKF